MKMLIAVLAAFAFSIPFVPDTRAATMPTISEFTMSTHRVTITGLQVTEVIIEVRIVAPDGQGHDYRDPWEVDYLVPQVFYPFVRLAKHDPVFYLPQTDLRTLRLVSGDDTDGLWRASVRVPATYDGAWRASVCVETLDTQTACIDPGVAGGDPTLTVVGRDQPRLHVVSTPAPSAQRRLQGTVVVRAFLEDSRRPIRNRVLVNCWFHDCYTYDPPQAELEQGIRARTDATGTARFMVDTFTDIRNDLWLLEDPDLMFTDNALYQRVTINPPRHFRLSARLASSSVDVGETTLLQGVVGLGDHAGFGRVAVQRRVNGAWITVGYAPVRASGRWSLALTPTRSGTYTYRVRKPSARCDGYRCLIQGTTSDPLRLTVR
jgi:hypothetical protein